MYDNDEVVEELEETPVVEEVVEEVPAETWEPVSFAPLQRADYGNKTQVRMGNIKPHADNEEMALVRKALHEKYPHAVPPGTAYDYDITRAAKKLQKSLGNPVTGILTREDVAELGKIASSPFTVV